MRSKTVRKTEAQRKVSAMFGSDYYAKRTLDELRLIQNQNNVRERHFNGPEDPALFVVCALSNYRAMLAGFVRDSFEDGVLLGLS